MDDGYFPALAYFDQQTGAVEPVSLSSIIFLAFFPFSAKNVKIKEKVAGSHPNIGLTHCENCQ